FEAFAAGADGGLASIGGGQFEGIGTAPRLHATAAGRAIARRAKLRCCARTGAECNEPSTGNG
ncbi:MAG: hypothetical protein ACK462_05215, partial [Planctomyces sp.]